MLNFELSYERPAICNKVSLQKLSSADKNKVCHWIISPLIVQNSFVVSGPHNAVRERATHAFAERYFEKLISDHKRLSYAIFYNNKIIGTTGIKDIYNSHADCFIDIGEDEFRGKGFGRAAMSQLLDRAFCSLSFTQISLDVLEFNKAALKLYQSLGFVTQDYHTWHYDEFALYWRVLRMSLTKLQWLNRSNEHVDY